MKGGMNAAGMRGCTPTAGWLPLAGRGPLAGAWSSRCRRTPHYRDENARDAAVSAAAGRLLITGRSSSSPMCSSNLNPSISAGGQQGQAVCCRADCWISGRDKQASVPAGNRPPSTQQWRPIRQVVWWHTVPPTPHLAYTHLKVPGQTACSPRAALSAAARRPARWCGSRLQGGGRQAVRQGVSTRAACGRPVRRHLLQQCSPQRLQWGWGHQCSYKPQRVSEVTTPTGR